MMYRLYRFTTEGKAILSENNRYQPSHHAMPCPQTVRSRPNSAFSQAVGEVTGGGGHHCGVVGHARLEKFAKK